jgi:hypothetical protein
MMFVPKNWLSKETDSLAKRFPAAAVDLENNPQNTVQLLMQTKKQLEKLLSKEDEPDIDIVEARLDARIDGVLTRLNELISRVDNLPTEDSMLSSLSSEIEAALEDYRRLDDNIFDLLATDAIDMGYMQVMPGMFKEDDSNGIDFDLLSSEILDFPDWVPSFNFNGGPVNANDGANVLNGLSADNITADIIAANTVIADSVATQLLNAREGDIETLAIETAAISGALALGAIDNAEECIDELRSDIDNISNTEIPNLQMQIDDLIKVPAPPDNVNDYALQSIGGMLTWVQV